MIGTFFGWSISVVGRGFELGAFVIPIVPLVVIGVIAVLGAVIAAIRPSWRAAHLDVLGGDRLRMTGIEEPARSPVRKELRWCWK